MGRFANHGLLGKMTGADEELVVWAMKSMQVWDLVDKPLRSLSGGQRQTRLHRSGIGSQCRSLDSG